MDPGNRVDPNQQISVIGIIWFALLMSLGIYGYVGYMQLQNTDPQVNETMRLALATLGVICLFISFLFRSRAYNVPAHCTAVQFTNHLTTNLIISWALGEAIGIYGLVLGFMGDEMALWGFLSVSIAWMLFNAPRLTWMKEELLKYNQLKDLNLSDD
jgi:hypothetical protein